MTHPADLYCETRDRVVAVASDLDPDLAVPACPGWTVHSVISHLVGLAADVVTGRVDGYAGPAWTERQVDERSDLSMSDLIDEWDTILPTFVETNRNLTDSHLPDTINHVLGPVPTASFEAAFHVDLLHHEHDLLGAARTPRRQPLPADLAAMRSQLANVRRGFAANRLPTLRISPTDADRTWDVGTDEPAAHLSAPTIELLRSFGGRRTHDQIRAYAWSGETTGMIEQIVLPFFSAPQQALPGG